jgi:hypothetical protein
VVRLPDLFQASIREDGLSLAPPDGTVLRFYRTDQYDPNEPVDSGIDINLPPGAILRVPEKMMVEVKSDGSAELPPETTVVLPKSEGSMHAPRRIEISSGNGVTLFWLCEGDSFVLSMGGAARWESKAGA